MDQWICERCKKGDPLPFIDNEINNMDDSEDDDENGFQYVPVMPKYKKFVHVNINGLKSKYDELRYLLVNEKNIIACALCETKLNVMRDYGGEFNIPEYTFVRKDRIGKEGGGVGVYVNREYSCEEIDINISTGKIELLILKITTHYSKAFLLVTVYIPPDCINEETFSIWEQVLTIIRTQKCEIIVQGDFNINLLSKDTNSYKLSSICSEFDLSQLIKKPTREAVCKIKNSNEYRKTSTLIDHTYVSNKENFLDVGSINFSTTDHKLTYVVYKKLKNKSPPRIITYRCYKNFNQEEFLKEFNKIDWTFLLNDVFTDNQMEIFEKITVGLIDKHVPIKRKIIKGNNAPWITARILTMCKERDEIRKSMGQNPDLIRLYNFKKNEVEKEKNKTRSNYFNKKFDQVKSSVDVWNIMNEIINFRAKSTCKIGKLENHDGKLVEDDTSITEKLASEFVVNNSCSNVNNCSGSLSEYESNYDLNDQITHVNQEVSAGEVQSALKYVKKGKEQVNTVPKRIYKAFTENLAVPLSLIFTNYFLLGSIPSSFKLAAVTPLFKGKGKRTHSSAYRPIFSLPFIAKVLERIIYNRLLYSVNDELDENQHGFRKRRSCQTAITKFSHDTYENLSKTNGKSMAVFIDFTKAFDTINQEKLIYKLMWNFNYKIPPYLIKLLINYFTNRVFRIINGDFTSKDYTISSGVPQGSILAALCYSLYINDIGKVIDLPYCLYADDLVLYVDCVDYEKGKIKLQECLTKVNEYCKNNDLKINVSKTKFMLFYKSKDYKSAISAKNPITLTIDNEIIERVVSFKYLGITIDSCMTFKNHYEAVDAKVIVAVSKLHSTKRLLSTKVIKTFLCAYVVSIIDYCLIIWAVQTDQQLQKIQNRINRFLCVYFYKTTKNKIICKVNDCDIFKLLSKIDLLTIVERRKLAFLKFTLRDRHIKMFQNWFVKSSVPGSLRFGIPKVDKSISKQTVQYNACFLWNYFVQKLKLCSLAIEEYDEFVDKCKYVLLQDREKLFRVVR